MTDKGTLVEHIKNEYFRRYNKTISPIKLQKSLYFLYAYWAGFANKKGGEVEFNLEDIHLFEADFEAWAFGPVDKEVHEHFKKYPGLLDEHASERLKKDMLPVQFEFVEGFLPKLFATSDFGLIDLSHKDQCWKRHFHPKKEGQSPIAEKMLNSEIVYEYTYNKD